MGVRRSPLRDRTARALGPAVDSDGNGSPLPGGSPMGGRRECISAARDANPGAGIDAGLPP